MSVLSSAERARLIADAVKAANRTIIVQQSSGGTVSSEVSLDAATLAALETVNVGNLPSTQAVSGTVELGATSLAALESTTVVDGGGSLTVDDGGSSITVDGTVELGATSLAALETISVANFPATQAVSLASVPSHAVTDGGGSLTVDGTVELGSASLAALETIQVGSLPSLPAGTNAIGKVMEVPTNKVAINLTAEAVAGIIAETAITFTRSVGNAATTTGTSYTPTAGKNAFFHTIILTWVATTTTANTARLRLRVNASGAATTSSPIQFSQRIGWESPTFIANEAEMQPIPIPGGLEVPNGGGLMGTIACAAANGTLDVTLLGYEYTP